jgi:4-hydroxybenzoate polyprenyltransferase
MKIIYTICFFLDTLMLIFVTYFFLGLSERGIAELALVPLFLVFIFCVAFLVYIIIRYLDLPA